MLSDLVFDHLITLGMILLFSIVLLNRRSSRDTDQRYFWLTVVSVLLLVLQNELERFASGDPSLRFWRILWSVIGYTFRSVAALGLLLVIAKEKWKRFVLWIPCLITLLVSATAFFSDIAFGYNKDYGFYRGPLGYVAFIVPILYMVLILWIVFRRYTESKGLQKYIIPGCVFFCLAATVVDALHGGARVNEAIMISSILFYMILHAHDNRRDPLTGLLNRKAFYDDCAVYEKTIEAVASLDMNGLKTMNDTLGHHAGDEALVRIAECMKPIASRVTLIYRIGGDEFVILFFHEEEQTVARIMGQIKDRIIKAGYSISAGYAMRRKNENLEDTVRESDRRMYEDKACYYLPYARPRPPKKVIPWKKMIYVPDRYGSKFPTFCGDRLPPLALRRDTSLNGRADRLSSSMRKGCSYEKNHFPGHHSDDEYRNHRVCTG